MRKTLLTIAATLLVIAASALTASAGPITVITGELAGPTDWLADVRFRNFNSTISDYEMAVNASPTRATGVNQVNGQVPGVYAFADWAVDNAFTITYDPGAGLVSLRLVGSGAQNNSTGPYDVTIGRAPDLVAGPVNYINFQLWDRVSFPTFGGLTISSLDGTNLGTFTLASAGIGSWSVLDPDGLTLNDGFILQGSFALDLTKLVEGREGDKIIFGIGSNPNVPAASVPDGGTTLALLGCALMGLGVLRRKFRA